MSRWILALASFSLATGCSCGDGGTGLTDGGRSLDAHTSDGARPTDATGVDATGDDGGTTDEDGGTIVDDDGGTTDPCGGCPLGTTCGTANSIPVCRDDFSQIPRFTSVFIIVMENTTLESLQSADVTPYLTSLFGSAASGSDYHGVDHPSLPNYLGMTSGMTTDPNIGCDCQPSGSDCTALNCNAIAGAVGIHCGCPQDVMHIGDQLEAAGLGWRDYGEDMGTACNLTDSGNYAARHNPFLYYANVQTDAARCTAHVVDYSLFDPDGDPQAFSFIAPNVIDDMHDPFPAGDTNLVNGDTWLAANVPPILASDAYNSGGLLVIVWDEDDLSGLSFGGETDDPIGIIVMSPYAKSGGYVSTETANHYSLLATVQDGFGLDRLANSASVFPLSDYFPDF